MDQAPKIALMVTDIPVAHPRIDYFRRLGAELNEGPARLPCHLVCDGQLYAGRRSLDAVRDGSAQMAWVNASHLEALAPELAVLNLPFGPGDDELREPARASALVRLVDSRTRAAGVRTLGVMRGADQLFASPRHELGDLAALRGLRVRVAGPGMYESIMRSLDAVPVALPIPELPGAFSGGALDCVFTSPGGWQTQLGPDVRFGTRVPGLMFITYMLVVDSAWFEGLDEAQALALQGAADQCVTWAWAAMERDDAEVLEGMTQRGASVRTVSDLDEWRRRTAPLREATHTRYPEMAAALGAVVQGVDA